MPFLEKKRLIRKKRFENSGLAELLYRKVWDWFAVFLGVVFFFWEGGLFLLFVWGVFLKGVFLIVVHILG